MKPWSQRHKLGPFRECVHLEPESGPRCEVLEEPPDAHRGGREFCFSRIFLVHLPPTGVLRGLWNGVVADHAHSIPPEI